MFSSSLLFIAACMRYSACVSMELFISRGHAVPGGNLLAGVFYVGLPHWWERGETRQKNI